MSYEVVDPPIQTLRDDVPSYQAGFGLDGADSVPELLNIARKMLAHLAYRDAIVARLALMIEYIKEDDEQPLLLQSVKGCIRFLSGFDDVVKPVITADESGYFDVNWGNDNDKMVIIFREIDRVSYLLFRPSRHTNERYVLSGRMHTDDFHDYLQTLNIKTHLSTHER